MRVKKLSPTAGETRYLYDDRATLVEYGSTSALSVLSQADPQTGLAAEETALNQGQLPPTLLQEFASRSIPLSQQITIEAGPDGVWSITDAGNQHTYTVRKIELAGGQVSFTVTSTDTTIKYNYGYELLSLTNVNGASRSSQFYLFDGLGSTANLTDEAGSLAKSYQYDAWGTFRAESGASSNLKTYTGHYLDTETGLHYFGARYYDSSTGQFLTQDSYLGEMNTPPSLHRYLFAYANPVRFVDLTGYAGEEITREMRVPQVETPPAPRHPYTDIIERVVQKNPELTELWNHSGNVDDFYAKLDSLCAVNGLCTPERSEVYRHPRPLNPDVFNPASFDPSQNRVVIWKEIWDMENVDPGLGKRNIVHDTFVGLLHRAGINFQRGGGGLYHQIADAFSKANRLNPFRIVETHVFGRQQSIGDFISGINNQMHELLGPVDQAVPDIETTGEFDMSRILGETDELPMAKGRFASALDAAADAFDSGTSRLVSLASDGVSVAGKVANFGLRALDVGVTAAGALGSGIAIGTGVVELQDEKWGAGITDIAIGGIGLTLDILAAKAVAAGTFTAGAIGAAGFAAGSSLYLAETSIKAALEGRETPVEYAQRYYGENMGSIGKQLSAATRFFIEDAQDWLGLSNIRGTVHVDTGGFAPLPALMVSQLAERALQAWQGDLLAPLSWEIEVQIANLPKNALAEARVAQVGAKGTPVAGVIVLDDDAAGVGWFVDSTPIDPSEFTNLLDAYAFEAKADSPAHGKYDLLTVLLHEMGHLLGMMPGLPAFDSQVQTIAGSQLFVGPNFTATLSEDRDHLDDAEHPYDLMNSLLAPGMRKVPVAARCADHKRCSRRVRRGATTVSDPAATFVSPFVDRAWNLGPAVVSPPGLEPLVARLHGGSTAPPHEGLVNAGFSIADSSHSAFGWSLRGSAGVDGGEAVLGEDSRLIAEFSQPFIVPDGVTALTFTITAANLAASGPAVPPDAFEVALLNSQTMTPLVAAAAGLTNTDALFNLQQTGEIYFGPQVTVPGVASSGQNGPLALPLTVTVDLSGVAAGSQATLFFNLLGFGSAASEIRIDNVVLFGAAAPPLTVQLDPLADSALLAMESRTYRP